MTRNAKIVADIKKPAIECNIIDLSAGGACIQLASDDIVVPKRFTLVHGATKKNCMLVWKRGFRIGVSF